MGSMFLVHNWKQRQPESCNSLAILRAGFDSWYKYCCSSRLNIRQAGERSSAILSSSSCNEEYGDEQHPNAP
ncbi:hypothetical protein VNO77_42096 [Canavalia gladiata]|uniref:Uncharacterized protein n=1 Tax=Canavalia gladiata TaxID=3824 RepID=A0AAN9K1R2_CANGL